MNRWMDGVCRWPWHVEISVAIVIYLTFYLPMILFEHLTWQNHSSQVNVSPTWSHNVRIGSCLRDHIAMTPLIFKREIRPRLVKWPAQVQPACWQSGTRSQSCCSGLCSSYLITPTYFRTPTNAGIFLSPHSSARSRPEPHYWFLLTLNSDSTGCTSLK